MTHPIVSAIIIACIIPLVLTSHTYAEPSTDAPRTVTLEEVIVLALKHNPTLVSGQHIVEAQQGAVRSARAYPNPSFGFQAGDGRVRDPSNGLSVTERVLTFTQPVEWPSTRNARRRAAEAGVESAQAGLSEITLDLIAKAKILFYELMLAENIARLSKESQTTIRHIADVVKKRVSAGDAAPFQQVKVNVELLQATQAVTKALAAVHTARTALNTITGGMLGSDYVLHGAFLSPDPDHTFDTMIEWALANHPTITKLRKRIEQANHRLAHEKHTRVPNVTLRSFYARDAGRESVGGGILIPIPLWYQQGGEIAGALAKKRKIEADLLNSRNELEQSILHNLQHLGAAKAQRKVYKEGFLTQAKEAVRIAQVSFQHGEASLLELLDAQRVLWQTMRGFSKAQFDLSAAIVNLERSLGTMPEHIESHPRRDDDHAPQDTANRDNNPEVSADVRDNSTRLSANEPIIAHRESISSLWEEDLTTGH